MRSWWGATTQQRAATGVMSLEKFSSKALRAELSRRNTARHERWMEKWRKENRCRMESCDLPLQSLETEVIETQRERPRFPDGTVNYWANPDEGEVAMVTLRVLEECDAGHKAMYHLLKVGEEEPFLSKGPYFQKKEWTFPGEGV